MNFVGVPDSLRDKHVYIVGKAGHGKSTLIQAMAYQDIMAGRGVCVIDPSGDLVKKLIHYIPKERVEDAIWLDTSQPIPIDFLSYRTPREQEILIDDIIMIFDPTKNAPRMRGILRALLPTLFEANANGLNPKASFLDIYHFIQKGKRYSEIMSAVSTERQEYWTRSFPKSGEAIEPIISRMVPFVESPTLRTIFGPSDSPLNIWDAMQEQKIILVSVDINESDRMFASLLVSKMQQAAFRRRDLPKSERQPFCLYVDEFENYQSSAFDVIVSQGRKFGLWLTLANQAMYQLDEKIKAAILGNVSTFMVFCIDDQDIRYFALRANPYDPEILASLPEFKALFKIGKESAVIGEIPPPMPHNPDSYAEIIRKRTVDKYSCYTAAPMLQLEHEQDEDEIQPTGRPTLPPHRD